ncbi:MAG: redoxin domain-containing protein [Ignavibacteria bacterium]|nr:redoxin domain-containing protein [Ignavibacteria bacterium]
MRFYLLQAFAILFISSQIHAQAPQEILSKAYSKCQSITHGKYSLVVRKKYMTVKDTSVVAINTTFQKYPADTVHPLLFHSTESHNNGYTISILYTGKEFVRIFPHDSTAEIMQSTRWATKIQSSIQSFFFFRPLTDVKSALLQYDTADIHYSISFKGMDTLRNEPCYAINVIEIPELDSTNPISVIKIVYRYWIRTDNYLPIRYIVDYEAVMNNDTLHQHEDFTLTSSTFDTTIDKAPLLLSNDTTAPEWTLNTIHNDTLTLKDLKGKLILLDFFYRSCAPCLLAMPGMQSLHTRYHD